MHYILYKQFNLSKSFYKHGVKMLIADLKNAVGSSMFSMKWQTANEAVLVSL